MLTGRRPTPYKSTLTGVSSADLSTGYEAASGKQWSQQLGASLALFDVANAALVASGDPKNKDAVANAIGSTNVETPVGQLTWGKGPNGNTVATPILGGQWVKATDGKYKLDFNICENSSDPNVPVAAKLKPFGT